MNRILAFILVLFLNAVCCGYIKSQEVQGQKPELNDHTFIPVSFMKSPFNNTSLMLPIGIGSTANFDFAPQNPALDTLKGLSGEILFADLGFRYHQKVQDWINFYLKLGLTARLGTNFESLLSQGFNTVVSFEIGTMIKLYQTEKTRLSLSAEVQNYDANFVDFNSFITDVINGNSNPRIVRDIPALAAGGGLHFAWGINDLFGVRGEATYAYGETFTRGKSSGLYSITGGVDVDFYKRFSVPVGIALTFTHTTEPDIVYVDDRSGRTFFWKLAYTGRKDFDLGIESGVMVLPLENLDEKPRIDMVNVVMCYFFN